MAALPAPPRVEPLANDNGSQQSVPLPDGQVRLEDLAACQFRPYANQPTIRPTALHNDKRQLFLFEVGGFRDGSKATSSPPEEPCAPLEDAIESPWPLTSDLFGDDSLQAGWPPHAFTYNSKIVMN